MNGIYQQEFRIRASDTDIWQRLRLSALLRMFQESSIAHTEALGAGREKTLDRGALWVVTRMKLQVSRMPGYDEEVILKSWPGETMHVVFPRYYQVETKSGRVLIRASSLWLLLSREQRSVIFPEKLGIRIEGVSNGTEMAMPESLVFPSVFPETAERTVQYSETDLNGHMNNSCYLDWMDDLLDVAFHRCHIIRSLQINFVSEVQTGQTVTIHWLLEDRLLFVKGCFDGRQIFAVRAIFQ